MKVKATLSGYEIRRLTNRETAIEAGIPESLLNEYEAAGKQYDKPGSTLFDWLQEQSDRFRS